MPKYHACLSAEHHLNLHADNLDDAAKRAVRLFTLPGAARVNVDDCHPVDDDADVEHDSVGQHISVIEAHLDALAADASITVENYLAALADLWARIGRTIDALDAAAPESDVIDPRAAARHQARMDQRRPVLVARLNDLGYTARIAGLGGNIEGIWVTTLAGRAWIITDDNGDWLIGPDDEDRTDDSPVPSISLGEGVDVVAHWADQIMGFDRRCSANA